MRDPLGYLLHTDIEVRRLLSAPLPSDHFLCTQSAKELVLNNQLVGYSIVNAHELVSPRIAFVSYPFEWCNAQLRDAADLTLLVSDAALSSGYELKDASAWNIIYVGCQPVFCDHLSFQKIETVQWWAFGQFVRHFIFPLCVAQYRGFNAKNSFKINRDGLMPEQAKSLMGTLRFFTRYWPLMLTVKGKTVESRTNHGDAGHSTRGRLYGLCRWFLNGIRESSKTNGQWLAYTHDRAHYTDSASSQKFNTIQQWLTQTKPNWVLDLGCNTGEFSKLAADLGANVIAVDLDHACIQNLYLSSKGRHIYPVITSIDDLSGGRGWSGDEFPGLLSRLHEQSDVVLMLALIHHLAISASIPYKNIAELAHKLSKRYLIVEFIEHSDALVQHLANQRQRSPEDFSIENQRLAFEPYFHIKSEVLLQGVSRRLMLLEKNEQVRI